MGRHELTVAVVGLGVGVDGHVPSLRAAGFKIAALGARRRNALEAAGKTVGIASLYTDFDALLSHPDLDAVIIATPPPSHCEFVLKALNAGKHVLVEKEFAMDSNEARQMTDAARRAGKTAMVAQAFRFSPSRAFVGWLIEQGYIGRVRQIVLSFFWGQPAPAKPKPEEHWRANYATGGGMSGGQMATFFEAITTWFGPVASIGGKVRVADPFIFASGHPADADDSLSATFEMQGGALGTVLISAATPYGQGGRIELYGSEGMLTIKQPYIVPSPEDDVFGGRYADGPGTRDIPIPRQFGIELSEGKPAYPMLNSYWPLARAFKMGIETGSSPSPNFEESYHLQRITDALRESSKTGRTVTL
jgi:predicted dehydrogenase